MARNNLRAPLTALTAISVLFSGCAPLGAVMVEPAQVSKQVAESRAAMHPQPMTSRGAVDRFTGPKLAGVEVKLDALETRNQASMFSEPFIYVSDSQTLAEVLQGISEQLERRIRVGSMEDEWQDGSFLRSTFPVDWRRGSTAGLLNQIAGRMNASWRVVDGDIEFYQNETRAYQVSLPPGSRTMSSSLSLGGSGGGAGGGSGGGAGGNSGGGSAQSTVSSTITLNTFEAVLNGVKALVATDSSSKGGQRSLPVIGNPELGLISVTGRPAMLERVGRHIESINERLAQNVMVQIKVMSVAISSSDYVGLGLDAILSRGLSKLQLTAAAPTPAGSGSPGFLTLSRTGGSLAGSEVVLGLLKQAGDVSVVRSGQVIAANGQPAGVQVADEINYLAQVSTSVVANAGTQTSLTPGTRTVGFTAAVLPMIMADNRLLLQYTLNLSSLLGLTQNSSGGQTIQTPQISSQTLQQQAYVKDGESIVLFGFEQDRVSDDRSVGIANSGVNSSKTRNAMVIVMDVARVGSR